MYFLATAIVLVGILVWALMPSRKNLPPGPYPFPIIGNILQLGQNPPQSLANLSKTYGPLMSLQLGSQYTVVVSSQEAAKAVLQEHDQALSSRTIASALQVHEFDKHSLAFSPAGQSGWKRGRRICKEQLFSTRRLDESQGLRQQKLTKLRNYLYECAVATRAVDVGEALFTTTVNLMSFTLFSTDFASFDSSVSQDLKETVEGFVKNLFVANIADFFPIFKPIDPQGIKRRSGFYMGKLLGKFEDIINSRLESRAGSSVDSSNKFDLLETLVNLMEDREYNLTVDDIKYLFLDLFLGGTHTTTSTLEWTMKHLLFNPTKMANAKNELRTVIGKNKQVEESDISQLPYLQAVIKETLRLHPIGPFLIPRRADREVEISGYTIPKNAQIFVNVWAIGRDFSIWSKPTSFEPERFLNSKIDYKGRDFTFLPFGSGRRICLGMPLADRMLPLMLASLIHEFDWKLQPGVKPQDEDASHNAVPLIAIPISVCMID